MNENSGDQSGHNDDQDRHIPQGTGGSQQPDSQSMSVSEGPSEELRETQIASGRAPQYGAPPSHAPSVPAVHPQDMATAQGSPAGQGSQGTPGGPEIAAAPLAGSTAEGAAAQSRPQEPAAHVAPWQRGYANTPTADNPTERIPVPAGTPGNPGQPQSTQAIPTNFAVPGSTSQGNHNFGAGQAGPGYPASNAYPYALAPAVTAHPKERKKVGMGLFASSVLAAALVGGLVAGGTMYLADLTGNNTVAGSAQQSSPLIINNPKSVGEVSAAAAKAMPSVVTISATSGSSGGTGSGIILDKEGYILTNTHVVTLDGAAAHAAIEVQTSDNKVYKATIVGTDPLSDLAVVKIQADNLIPAALGESSKINVGDTVIAIGSPLGLNGTVTDGIVSTLNRTIQVASSAVPETPSDTSQDPSEGGNGFRFSPPGGAPDNTAAQGTVNLNVIQTDAAINPGNSGGALVNTAGQVIGVNVAIASTGSSATSSSQSGNIGVGFSIPIDHAQRVAQEIIKTGKASHGQLGVSVKGTSSTGGNSAFSTGATVASVTAGSAAAKVGLQENDVIIKLGERRISDPADLTAAVREQAAGATVKMDFTRNGRAHSVDVTLDAMAGN